jgi:hypothetical protein
MVEESSYEWREQGVQETHEDSFWREDQLPALQKPHDASINLFLT